MVILSAHECSWLLTLGTAQQAKLSKFGSWKLHGIISLQSGLPRHRDGSPAARSNLMWNDSPSSRLTGWGQSKHRGNHPSISCKKKTCARCVAKDNTHTHTFHTWGDSSISFKVNCRHKNLPFVICNFVLAISKWPSGMVQWPFQNHFTWVTSRNASLETLKDLLE